MFRKHIGNWFKMLFCGHLKVFNSFSRKKNIGCNYLLYKDFVIYLSCCECIFNPALLLNLGIIYSYFLVVWGQKRGVQGLQRSNGSQVKRKCRACYIMYCCFTCSSSRTSSPAHNRGSLDNWKQVDGATDCTREGSKHWVCSQIMHQNNIDIENLDLV